MLEVLRLNIWYLSQRQAQRCSRDDDTIGSNVVLYLPYKLLAKGYNHIPPVSVVIWRSRNVTTEPVQDIHLACIICPYKADFMDMYFVFFCYLYKYIYMGYRIYMLARWVQRFIYNMEWTAWSIFEPWFLIIHVRAEVKSRLFSCSFHTTNLYK